MTQLAGRYELCAFPKRMLAAADEQTVADWVRREQPDVIVHTAALSDTGYSEKHPDESYRANVLLPCWMAAAAQKAAQSWLRSALTRSTRALLSTGRLTRIHRSPRQRLWPPQAGDGAARAGYFARCRAAAGGLDVRPARVRPADPR
ncbi:sugar nucleotide-binding protein [Gemmiger formicilis]|nr:sugar nucleotide-binding protein [Gemmiger formicilis]